MYHFISGYTAKVAGTERGITEPTATFSALFGAPFMALHPTVYADLFGKLIAEHDVGCWLVNTGWTGGAYPAGERIRIAYSRALVQAATSGALADVSFTQDPVFGFDVPRHCPDVPDEVLQPRGTWSDSSAYDGKAEELAKLFAANFAEYADHAAPEVRAAGPLV
jgi:phosphoenolpyruvate carboxykinase (ATP)